VLSGGSAFGLDAAASVMDALAAEGRGFAVAGTHVPIVPAAVLFDLNNGGVKEWGPQSPYRHLGRAALKAAAQDFALGSAGAGTGATVAGLKGGLGSASTRLQSGITVAALAAVNAVGQVTIGDGPHFWAALFEVGAEFGGLGLPSPIPADAAEIRHKLRPDPRGNTTLTAVATDAVLTKAQAKRIAIAAHAGFARALWPSHTPFDGDLVFALSTGRAPLANPGLDMLEIGAAAGACVARAIARAVYEAATEPGDRVPTWRERFGQAPR
jgi:L-aminopeptidase/D-esterase-like protein